MNVNTKNFFLLFLSILILGLASAWRLSQPEMVKIPTESDVIVEVTIKNEPRLDGRSQIVRFGDCRAYTDIFPRYRVGDKIRIKGFVDERCNIFNPRIEKLGETRFFGEFLFDLRRRINANFELFLPAREATLLSGTVIGVDSIERGFRDELVKTGTIHVVVVSGQNLMIVAGVFFYLFKYLGRRLSLFLGLIAVIFYSALTGFEPPVLRAAMMVIISTIAIYYGRQLIALWSLFLTALFIVFLWPGSIFDVSFQLTFAATLGIMTLGKFLSSRFSILPFFGQNAAIATSAYVFTMPIILFYFGQVSLLAPIVNLLIAELVFPIMVLGFLAAIFSLIFLPIAQILAYLAYVPAATFVLTVELFSKIPVGTVGFGKGSLIFVFVFYFSFAALFAAYKLIKTRQKL